MPEFKNAMEVFKLLDKSNCRKCNETTCLAFASKVFLGRKSLDQCPVLSPEVQARYQGHSPTALPGENELKRVMAELTERLADCDLEDAARRTGGTYRDGWLTLRILGKPFSLNRDGQFRTDLHVNPWIAIPVLWYVLDSEGQALSGEWVPYRELKGARERHALFVRRGEEPLKQIAQNYPGLFEDLVDMFSGQSLPPQYEADLSLVLYPLPLVPMMICYWRPDDGMDSELTLFFDRSTDRNGGSSMVFNLATGLVQMFGKFALTHGVRGA
ncbi:MAG: DUF3786 domain-containing protein [Desulfobacterales bacterium]|nr:DUF3786 domain-containing protein [Desulfobacterales bacterium]